MRFGQTPDAEEEPQELPTTQDQTYITIKPADDQLDPATVTTGFRRLHQLDRPDDPSLLERLRNGTPTPTIEFLLVADPTEDTSIQYAVTVDPPIRL